MNQTENFIRQQDEASRWALQQYLQVLRYKSLFPEKIDVMGDEFMVHDANHFSSWCTGHV